MNTQEKIEVMQSFLRGEKIEYLIRRAGNPVWYEWFDGEPNWNWETCRYRVAQPKPITVPWHALHPDIKYVACDVNGSIYGYTSMPVKHSSGIWAPGVGGHHCLSRLIAGLDRGTVPWDKSLVTRPDADELAKVS